MFQCIEKGDNMHRCQYFRECAFYNGRLAEMPDGASFLRSLYCHKLSHKCQRYKRADEVPVSDPANELPPLFTYARQ
jgi:hypothetical protein